jgi:porphobilinogen synthase
MVAETDLALSQLIQPYFLSPQKVEYEPIAGFSGVNRWGEEALIRQIVADRERGLSHFLIFGKETDKDSVGSPGLREDSSVPKALRRLKKELGDSVVLYTDVCLCPYTSHGHCGIWENQQVVNDPSVRQLVEMACVHAEAGADFVAPSDMMDGRVGAIRAALDARGLDRTGILAYSAKYASNYYGPFREALDSSPEAGSDRSGYQMDFRNRREAQRELRLDIAEGADMVMVKPALAYLDILSDFRAQSEIPVVAYSVSGEYQMVKLMAQVGLADERRLALENLFAIRRAGASAVITYFATQAAKEGWLR